MKRIALIVAAVLTSVCAFAQAPKFARVNIEELVYLTAAADSARAQIDAMVAEADQTLREMADEGQKKYAEYQQKANTWSESTRKMKEEELAGIQNRIQTFQQNNQADLQEQQNKLMAPIQQKAMDVINKLAKEGGFTLVFTTGQFLYVDESQVVDLTPAARKLLRIPDCRTLESLQAELQAKAAAAQQNQ